jgi:hypothetical protein
MLRLRNYWIYCAGLGIVLIVVLGLIGVLGTVEKAHTVLLVFLGFCIGCAPTTVARYVYPPPKRWRSKGDRW